MKSLQLPVLPFVASGSDRRKLFRKLLLLTSAATGAAWLFPSSPAHAACVFVPTAGNDTFVCDSGASVGGLTDTGGSNGLSFPAGGTGTLNGNVVFGAGNDSIDMQSGTIAGTVNQGSGADSFVIGAGSVTGNVQQGSGIDDFRMTGGTVQSLSQGDNLDTFFMSGGRIVDAFEDGDMAVMTGGRIGRVNMKLDDNLFDMSGGTIDGNLVTGFGNDTIILSDGLIGGNISVSGGTDSVTITGGVVGGNVTLSFGSDTVLWENGGIVYGALDLGPDNDTATLRNISTGNLGTTAVVDGNTGTDVLTLDNVSLSDVAGLTRWETIAATNDTELTFDGTLTLGDSATGTGTLTIDATSTMFGGGANGAIAPFTAGHLADVVNSGRIDLTNGGSGPGDSFTITGNYTGNNGLLFLDTELGDDSSPSDKLVISDGTASGLTTLGILNAGGTGGQTTGDGIMVVEALNGATTAASAFALTGPVAAGAYEYLLFKGGVSAGSSESWYLRSTLVSGVSSAPLNPVVEPEPVAPEPLPPPPPPSNLPPVAQPTEGDAVTAPVDPEPPIEASDPAPQAPPQPAPVATADAPPATPAAAIEAPPIPDPAAEEQVPPTPGATPVVADIVPLYRVETPTYSVVPALAQTIGLAALGTFHERRGEQSLLQTTGALPAAWGRAYGQDNETTWSGTVFPTFDGSLAGIQAGLDVIGFESIAGHVDRAGFFVGYTSSSGDVRGQALGWNNLSVGDIDLHGTSFGGYWTHVAPQGWYLDAVLMGTWFEGDAKSTRDIGIELDGSGVTASLEGGYPIPLIDNLILEPQAQLVWQRFDFDDTADEFSTVSFDEDGSLYGRAGLRLQTAFAAGGATFKPYAKANLWHGFSGSQSVMLGTDPISTDTDWTALEVGGGLVAEISKNVAFQITGDYTTNIAGEKRRVWEGSAGLTISW